MDISELSHDMAILSRNYSRLRTINQKWSKEILKAKSLSMRIALKRNPSLFSMFYSFWQQINPFSLRSISKSLYFTVNDFIYKEQLEDESKVMPYLRQDMMADFQGRQGMTFLEFYDSFFELLDNLTKTQLVSEYFRVFKAISERIHNSGVLKYFHLAAKLHLNEPPRPSYQPWMLDILKQINSLKIIKGMNSKTHKSSKTIKTPSLAYREKQEPRQSDVTLRKIKQLSVFTHSRRSSKTLVRPKTQYKVRYEKTARAKPVKKSNKKKFRNTYLLENVIDSRKKLFEEENN